MTINYILIDYENIQPHNLEILLKHPFKIFVFVGASQTKLPFELVEVMQHFGENACYIKMTGSGKNALDFHLAYYLGQLTSQNPKAHFHVISKDAGFDPLITHLKSQGIRIQREKDLAEIPLLRISAAKNNDDKIAAIVKNLTERGQSRPRKVQTLKNTINSLFTEQIPASELTILIELLQKQKYISIKENSVSYKIPN